MDRKDLTGYLRDLQALIASEREAARQLNVDEMLALTRRKESLLLQLQSLISSVDHLTEQERKLADAVYSENLRNAYFFWSALKWVRQSVAFINDQISPASYQENGAVARARSSGALLCGRA